MSDEKAPPAPSDRNAIEPLPGEPGIPNLAQPRKLNVSKKALLTVGALVVTLVVFSTITLDRFLAGFRKGDADSRNAGDRPAASSLEARRLDMTLPFSAASAPTLPRVPAIVPTAEERADPIGLRQSAPASAERPRSVPLSPEDAPTLLVSSRPSGPSSASEAGDGVSSLEQTRRQLQDYQRRLQGMLETTAAPSAPVPSAASNRTSPVEATGRVDAPLLGGSLPSSRTSAVNADVLRHRSLVLPKGTTFTCALKTRIVSAASGFVGCQVQRDVFGDDGRVLLLERGSHLDGEYRITSIKPGVTRIPVVWVRARTPNGVTVDLDSPGTGQLGESGIDGFVDNRWPERIGAALLLSLIDDAVRIVIQRDSSDSQGSTVVLPATTGSTSKLAEKVLESTINIPPLIYRNQGGIVGIYVARDVDFSTVYALAPTAR